MDKNFAIIIGVALVFGIAIVFFSGSKPNALDANVNVKDSVQNSEIKDGIQYVKITAKGGYAPSESVAKPGIPTKLVVKTNGTYDCSIALSIRSIGFQKILAQTGEEIIDLGTPKSGETIKGTCSMGMYNFSIKFGG